MREPFRISTAVFFLMAATFAVQAEDARGEALESVLIETPGLPAVRVFVGPTTEADHAARVEQQRAAERTLLLPMPDYPAAISIPLQELAVVPQPTLILAEPVMPDLPVPPPLTGLDARAQPAGPTALAEMPRFDFAAALKSVAAKPDALAHNRLTRAQRDDIIAFYAGRSFQPLWYSATGLGARGAGLREVLLGAADDGLDATAYATVPPQPGAEPGEWAVAEFRLSQAAVLYARDAQGGRIDAKRLSDLIDPSVAIAAPSAILGALANAENPAGVLSGYNPEHAGYRALRAHLVQLRLARAAEPSFAAVPETVSDGIVHALPAKRTRSAALASAGSRQEADIIANMERWRWLPRALGERHVFVNIPQYRIQVMDGGRGDARSARDRRQTGIANTSVF